MTPPGWLWLLQGHAIARAAELNSLAQTDGLFGTLAFVKLLLAKEFYFEKVQRRIIPSKEGQSGEWRVEVLFELRNREMVR